MRRGGGATEWENRESETLLRPPPRPPRDFSCSPLGVDPVVPPPTLPLQPAQTSQVSQNFNIMILIVIRIIQPIMDNGTMILDCFLSSDVNRSYCKPPSCVWTRIYSSRGAAGRADLSWSQITLGRLILF